ncbi:hypothetical protein Tsubulata_031239 [Turnera subulata]|uniref:Phorbol-ester/DAG-type domain-containing protein n=1 Tax=Turnera subulata TaxID=218843 RepID=A0A9Q0GCZ6_9ROSI|nr:hypothetical protein Tsubulata_031239 [Turnera subulata]
MLVFRCEECDFTLDLRCGLSKEKKPDDQQKKPTTLEHFSHRHHSLKLLNSTRNNFVSCRICADPIVGPGYGCTECRYYLHVACAESPLEIQHPYHPHHPLRASSPGKKEKWPSCKVCRVTSFAGETAYQCRPCGFVLHMACARKTLLSVPLKHACHQHNLYYITGKDSEKEVEEDTGSYDHDPEDGESDDDAEEKDSEQRIDDGKDSAEYPDEPSDDRRDEDTYGRTDNDSSEDAHDPEEGSVGGEGDEDEASHYQQHKWMSGQRNACKEDCDSSSSQSYYQCLECNYYIHLKCIGLPATVKHSHVDLLFLVEKFTEDDSGIYYCQLCGLERDKEYPVYMCKECPEAPYTAHIECVISEDANIDNHITSGWPVKYDCEVERHPTLIEFDEGKRKPRCKMQIERNPFHGVYHCKECMVIAHNGCVLEEEDDALETVLDT